MKGPVFDRKEAFDFRCYRNCPEENCSNRIDGTCCMYTEEEIMDQIMSNGYAPVFTCEKMAPIYKGDDEVGEDVRERTKEDS